MSAPLVEIDYFRPTCRQVLGPYFLLYGFEATTSSRGGIQDRTSVLYSNGEIILDVGYWPEDYPNYSLMIGLGFLQGRRYLVDSCIGLWYAMPPDKQVPWRFRSEQELETVLRLLRDDVLPAYAEPLWREPQLLRQLINRYQSERSAKGEAEAVQRERRKAEVAFKTGNFREVVRIYSELSPVDLTPTDRKRFDLARKKLN